MSVDWNEFEKSEKLAFQLLQHLGYDYIQGEQLIPLVTPIARFSMRDVLLESRLVAKIKTFNHWIDDSNIKQILRTLKVPTISSLIEFNKQIWRYLTKPGELFVEQDLGDGKGRRNHAVTLIDWEFPYNNDYLVTNQFKINNPKANIIPDLVIFINGLPLVVIECKSPIITNPLSKAITQVGYYQDVSPKLFWYNQFIIVTSGESARFGVINNSFEHYQEWKIPYPITIHKLSEIVNQSACELSKPRAQEFLLYGLLEKKNLLDLIRNFIIYERRRGELIKKIARYQQFIAVNKTINRILTAKDPLDRGGTIWHTQGSGKSLTMLFTAIKLRRESSLKNPLVVFVSDRIDLVKQLSGTFENCGYSNPIYPKKTAKLRELLEIGQGVTVFTTIQRFYTKNGDDDEQVDQISDDDDLNNTISDYPVLNNDYNIFVLVDEAHRSQYKNFALNMRSGLPNACYLAYTGTPLAHNEKNMKVTVGTGKTVSKFGTLIDIYDIRQSVDDGATVPILYESRLPELQLEGDSIDAIFQRTFTDKTEKEKEEIMRKYGTTKAVLSSTERIKKVTLDIIDHFEQQIQPNGFKAQIVVFNRELAVKYKQYLDQYNAPESVVIISPNRIYDKELEKLGVIFITDKQKQETMIERFTDPDDSLTFLIVCDMLLTGFDAPIEQAMYLDKPLKEHNLLQAIARVNRPYENKNYGLIVDYYGVSIKLKQALQTFDQADIEGFMRPIDSELPILEQRHLIVMSHFEKIDINDLEDCIDVLEPEDKRADFYADFKRFSQSLDIVLPNPQANRYMKDLRLLGKITTAARNRFRDEQLNIKGCGDKIKRIIDEHIRSVNVQQLVKPVPILSDQFQESLQALISDKARASEMEHAVKHEITIKMDFDPVFYKNLKERLEEIIEAYNSARITLAEKIQRLAALIKVIKGKPDIARQLGLNTSELAFFNLFKEELTKIGISDDAEIVKFTYEIMEVMEEFITLVDWQHKPIIVKKLRKVCKDVMRTATSLEANQQHPLSQRIVELAKTHYAYRR